MDSCKHCIIKGNLPMCLITDCNVHESWYAKTMQSAIDDWCEESKFGAENWKAQPHIKTLFDFRSK